MSEIQRIVDQMDRAFAGDAWHGPSLEQVLDGISAEDASRHPIAQAHSIWELLHHVRAWNAIVRRRLRSLPHSSACGRTRTSGPIARTRTTSSRA